MTTHVRLLGAPEITRGDSRVTVDTRKAIALLAYLVISGPTVTRDRAAFLLWPDHDHTSARGALRRTLSTLRRAIGAEHIAATRQQIELVSTGLDVDVVRFEDLAATADPSALRAAWDLYRDDLLLGFGLRDSPEFDDWHRSETERLRGIAGDVLDRLSRLASGEGAFADAVRHAEARLRLDPLSERAHRHLMELEAQRGDRSAAVARYRALVRTLNDELGVEPLAETTAAYDAIRRGESPRPTPPPTPVTAELAMPMYGRDAQIAAILAAIPRTRERGHLVLIEAAAGMGATRLATEAVERLRGLGAEVAFARCHANETELEYASIISLIRGLLAGRRAADLDLPQPSAAYAGALVSEFATGDDPAPGLFRLYEALTDVILSLAEGPGPPVLVLDDVHRIDRAGSTYLRFLLNRLSTTPIAIVATVHPDDAGPAESLQSLARALARESLATIVGIGALTEDDTLALAEAAGHDDGDGAGLWGATGGIPLYIAEYLQSEVHERFDAEVIPESLIPIVTARLDALGAAANQTLAAVAVLGEPSGIDLIRQVGGRSTDEIADAIDDLVRAGVLMGDEMDRYVPTNTLIDRVAYEHIGMERRRLLHHRAAVALDGRPGRAASAARHFQRSGDDDEAARSFATAGDDASRVFAHDAARSHYQAALNLGHPAPDRLRESIGDLAVASGRYPDARQHYELVAATQTGSGLARIERKLGLLRLRMGDPEIAISHFRSALAEVDEGDASVVAGLLADMAAALSASGAHSEGMSLLDRAHDAAQRSESPAALAAVENTRGLIADRTDDKAAARAAFELSLHLAEMDRDPVLTIAATNNLALAMTKDGEHQRARELFESALGLAMRTGEEHRAAAIHSNLADLLQSEGDTEAAAAHIRHMAELMAGIGAQFDTPTPGIWMQTAW